MTDDPTAPAFWDVRYESQTTPWDFGGVPAPLARYLGRGVQPRGARVLIPGCGAGHEITAFAAAGCDVTAIDFSPPAVTRARQRSRDLPNTRVIAGDFFTEPLSSAPFDLVYERTFLCALPPAWRKKIVQRTAALLRPGGTLAGIWFFEESDDGPPFGLAPGEAAQLYDPLFRLEHDEPVAPDESLEFFRGRERWQVRVRKEL